jgi:UDP-glucose 4-epimerase
VKKALVTGAAGFVGSHLVDSLLHRGWKVLGIDNFSTGQIDFLKEAQKNSRFNLKNLDLLQGEIDYSLFDDTSRVYHLSANADIRFGTSHPNRDFEQNTIVTQRVLEASRVSKVPEFVFVSTGSVYGETSVVPTPETAPFPIQTSLYGASKLAGEGLVAAYAESFNIRTWIFRFVSIVGPRYSHGHIFDFVKQLQSHPEYLKVLGNGQQKKSYLHVLDCIDAIHVATGQPHSGVEIFNLGTNDFCTVSESIKWITDELQMKPKIELGTEIRGWIGDVPLIYLDIKKINSLGWNPKFSIEYGVRETVRYLNANQWLIESSKK